MRNPLFINQASDLDKLFNPHNLPFSELNFTLRKCKILSLFTDGYTPLLINNRPCLTVPNLMYALDIDKPSAKYYLKKLVKEKLLLKDEAYLVSAGGRSYIKYMGKGTGASAGSRLTAIYYPSQWYFMPALTPTEASDLAQTLPSIQANLHLLT